MMYRLPTGQTFQVYSYDTVHPLAAPKLETNQTQDPQTVQEVLQGSGFTDSDTGKEESGEGKPGRKKTKGRRTTNLGPRLQVIGVVLASEITEGEEEGEEASAPVDGELKVECQMETPRQKTVTFEFKTSDMVPEDIANTFIKENLLAKIHKQILVEQLYEIVKQLKENPDKVPVVSFPPEESLKREKSVDARKEKSEDATTVGSNDVSPQTSIKSGPSSPARRLQSVQREDKEVKMSRFLISPVVEQKAPPSEEDSASAAGSDVQVSSAVSTPLNLTPESTMSHISMLGGGQPVNRLDRPANLPTEDLMDGGDMSVSCGDVSVDDGASVSLPATPQSSQPGEGMDQWGEGSDVGSQTTAVSETVSPGLAPEGGVIQYQPPIPDPAVPETGPRRRSVDEGENKVDNAIMRELEGKLTNILGRESAPLAPSVVPTVAGIIPLDVVAAAEDGEVTDTVLSNKSVASVRSNDENFGEGARKSTPLQSPDGKSISPQESVIIETKKPEKEVKISRFDVRKVSDVGLLDFLPPTDLPIPETEVVMRGPLHVQISPEEEQYDSSPSPGSYYDTASEDAPFPTTENSQSTEYFFSHSSDDKINENEPPPLKEPTMTLNVSGQMTPLQQQLSHVSSQGSQMESQASVGSHPDSQASLGSHMESQASLVTQLDSSGDSRMSIASMIDQGHIQNYQPGMSEKGFIPVEPGTYGAEILDDSVRQDESFISEILKKLDDRHMAEMELLQKKMEELQRNYMQEKENLTNFRSCQNSIQRQGSPKIHREVPPMQSTKMFSPPPVSSKPVSSALPHYNTIAHPVAARMAWIPNQEGVPGVDPGRMAWIPGQEGPYQAWIPGKDGLEPMRGMAWIPGHPQQQIVTYSGSGRDVPQYVALSPHSFLPPRVSPRPHEVPDDDIKSVQSEPSEVNPRFFPDGVKRDSFSDSGADSSETNTPTRGHGHTITEGLLRYIHDNNAMELRRPPQHVPVIQATGQPQQVFQPSVIHQQYMPQGANTRPVPSIQPQSYAPSSFAPVGVAPNNFGARSVSSMSSFAPVGLAPSSYASSFAPVGGMMPVGAAPGGVMQVGAASGAPPPSFPQQGGVMPVGTAPGGVMPAGAASSVPPPSFPSVSSQVGEMSTSYPPPEVATSHPYPIMSSGEISSSYPHPIMSSGEISSSYPHPIMSSGSHPHPIMSSGEIHHPNPIISAGPGQRIETVFSTNGLIPLVLPPGMAMPPGGVAIPQGGVAYPNQHTRYVNLAEFAGYPEGFHNVLQSQMGVAPSMGHPLQGLLHQDIQSGNHGSVSETVEAVGSVVDPNTTPSEQSSSNLSTS